MVASENPELIEGRHRLIFTHILDHGDDAEYYDIDDYGAESDEEDDNGSGGAGVSTCETKSATKEVEEVHQCMKYGSISYYIFKPPSFLAHGFKDNNKTQDMIFNHICDFEAREGWRRSRRAVSSYLGFEIIKYQ